MERPVFKSKGSFKDLNAYLKATKEYMDYLENKVKSLQDQHDAMESVYLTTKVPLDKIRVEAIRSVAEATCPVTGPVITSKDSRKQIMDYASFLEVTNEEE